MPRFLSLLLLFSFTSLVVAQERYSISGVVADGFGSPIEGAHVYIHELRDGVATNNEGFFEITTVDPGAYRLHISYIGYRCIHNYHVDIKEGDSKGHYVLIPDDMSLEEVTVVRSRHERIKREQSVPIEVADNRFIEQNLGSSLMKSLEMLPGVSSMEVGQGFAKPAIRGLGFSRVVVTDAGVKMEGQQWGADHGLEVDQFGVERVEVVKGPASLAHGSDAIAGVVQILPAAIPPANSLETSFTMLAKSVNSLLGTSAMAKVRGESFFAYARFTYADFADYRVPADSVFYNRYRLPIYNQRLKNTAGQERNAYLTLGSIGSWGRSSVSVSNVFGKTGFFPGAHGIPNANDLQPGGSWRSIDLPYQQVNHFKVQSNSSLFMGGGRLVLDFGYQNNHRQEWSSFHTHYVGQQPPEVDPDLELDFNLHTFTSNTYYEWDVRALSFTSGVSSQFQHHGVGGYSFLLPNYTRSMAGAFLIGRWTISESLLANVGVRYDYGLIRIQEYISPYSGSAKAPDFNGDFNDFSWAAGFSYSPTDVVEIKTNLGKSFRMPSAIELGANGIHHGSFRYEVGDPNITSEYAYQMDIAASLTWNRFRMRITPFTSYFPNFISLSPTGSYLHPRGEQIMEADAGQIYMFLQSEAFRAGGEVDIKVSITPNLSLIANGEFIYATDYTYPIPFTPPPQVFSAVEYDLPYYWRGFHKTNVRFTNRTAAPQNRNSRNELSTPGHTIFGCSLSTMIVALPIPFTLSLQVQNIFDRLYWNHVNYYRSIDIPEAGRNFQIVVSVPFERLTHGEY